MRRLLLPALAASLLLTAPAAAAPSWLPPVNLTGENEQRLFSDLAVAPDGTTVVAWTRPAPGGSVVEATRRAPGGGFEPPVALTTAAEEGTNPSVGIDAQGNATVAWAQAGNIVRAARWPARAAFEPAQTLSGGPCTGANDPVIGVGAGGTAVVAFEAAAGPTFRVKCAAVRDGAGGPFGAATVISTPPRDDFQPTLFTGPSTAVAVNAAGDVAIAWAADIDPAPATERFAVEATFRPAGAAVPIGATVDTPAASRSQTDPAAAIAPNGRVTLAWSDDANGGGAGGKTVQYADRPPGGTFSPGVTANLPGEQAEFPDLAATGDGTVIGAWISTAGADERVQAAVRPPGGAFGGHTNLSAPGMALARPTVGANAAGHAMIAWDGNMADGIFTVRRTPDGRFGGVLTAAQRGTPPPGESLDFFNPDIALDDQGNAAAAWLFNHFRGGTDHNRIQSAAFDAAPPSLTSSVPPGGTAGTAIRMSAAATDRLTPVSIAWAFGDGGTATGGAVTHAFGRAGAFTVTVTATDAVGNATSATHPVLVRAKRKKRITSAVRVSWEVDDKRTWLLRMSIPRTPKKTKAQLRCSGKKCPFKQVSSKKRRKGTIRLFKAVSVSKALRMEKRSFRAGQRLELRITAPGYIGKVVRYRLRDDQVPKGKNLCLPVGAKKPRKRCP